MKHYYPAVFEPADDIQGFMVYVPDIEACFTQGYDIEEAFFMAHDVIGCMLDDVLEENYPKPSDIREIDLSKYAPGSFTSYVEFDNEIYRENCNPIKAAREKAGLNIKQLSDLLHAPYPTVKDWNNGRRRPPKWVEDLVLEKIRVSTI